MLGGKPFVVVKRSTVPSFSPTGEPTPVNKHDAQSKTDQLNQQNDHLAKVGIQEEFSIEDVSMSNFTTMKSSLL